jgi:hypothetical protein
MTRELWQMFPKAGFSIEYGVYAGAGYPDGRLGVRGQKRIGYGHEWLRLQDGTIVDAAVTQFGEDVARIIGPGDLRQHDYQPEWYPKDSIRERVARMQQQRMLVDGWDEEGFFIPAASIQTQVLSQRMRPGHKLWRRS